MSTFQHVQALKNTTANGCCEHFWSESFSKKNITSSSVEPCDKHCHPFSHRWTQLLSGSQGCTSDLRSWRSIAEDVASRTTFALFLRLPRATKIQARYPDILVSMPEYKALIPFDAICNFITGRNLFTRTADLPNNILMYLTPPSLLVNQRWSSILLCKAVEASRWYSAWHAQHRGNRFVRACGVKMHMDMLQEPSCAKNERKLPCPRWIPRPRPTYSASLRSRNDSTCTWTCHRNHFLLEFAGKIPHAAQSKCTCTCHKDLSYAEI